MKRVRTAALVLALVLAAALGLLFWPTRWTPPPTAAHPASSYAEALARLRRLEARDDAAVHAECRTRFLGHGHRAARCFVLLHGFTNCPRQFERLGEMLYEDGANVLVPRMPRHGIANPGTAVLAGLTAGDLVATAEEAVDIARGLGERVSVVGLSTSAVVAAWTAEHRADLDEVMLIAPAFAPKGIPEAVAIRLTSVLLRAPNFFVWWDPRHKEEVPGPRSAYPGFASRALASVYQLGAQTLAEASRSPAPAARALIVTTARDEGVNNAVTRDLAKRWRERGVAVEEFEFPAEAGVHHDMIDPEQPYQRVALTYPLIRRFLATGRAPLLADSARTAQSLREAGGTRAGGRNELTTSLSSSLSQGASRK